LVAETILASLLLKETVTPARWAGTALVALGVYLLAH
jgi:drug/metabolite transporter (DMT)-like permease